jgi:hypothetical protein
MTLNTVLFLTVGCAFAAGILIGFAISEFAMPVAKVPPPLPIPPPARPVIVDEFMVDPSTKVMPDQDKQQLRRRSRHDLDMDGQK